MNFIKFIINIIYPNVCGFCDKICRDDICIKCMSKLNREKECKKHIYLTKNFSTHMHIFRYDDCIRDSIIKYKFASKPYKCKAFVNFIIKDKKICGFLKKYDIIIPVPISKQHKLKRGYNQSELIMKELKKHIENIEVCTDVLYKIKNTPAQSSLNKEQRKNNLINAYKVKNNEKILNKKILLFDDIFTTGSTVDECSRVLKNSGAYDVRGINTSKRLKEEN